MLKKRLALNFGANLFAQFVTVIVQLASVPLFLSFWPKERYGAWIIISSIPAYLSLGEAGFATSSANEVSMAVAEGNYDRARRSLHTAWGFLVAISLTLLALTVAALFAIPWSGWLKSSTATSNEARWTIFLLSTYTIVGILIGIFGTVYRAAYRNARNASLSSASRLIEFVAMGAGIALTSSMILIAGLMLAVRLATFLFFYLDSRQFSPDLNLGISAFSAAELKRSWRPSVMFMAATLGNAIYFQGLTLLVGAKLGANAVVVFNTMRALTRTSVQFVVMITCTVWPEYSYLFGSGKFEKARRLNGLAIEVSWSASFLIAVMLYLTAPWIMTVWTRGAVHFDRALLCVFLAAAVLNGIWFVTSGFLKGINRHEGLSVRYVVAAGVALLIGAVVVRPLGLFGVAFAMVACELLLLPYAISRTCQLLEYSPWILMGDSVRLRVIREIIHDYFAQRRARACYNLQE